MERTFDRVPAFDPRSRAFGVRASLSTTRTRRATWRVGPNLDQGAEGACVGFGWEAEAGATPAVWPIDNGDAVALYHEAQVVDRAEGRVWAEGASVLAGAKAVVRRGRMTGYRWCFGLDDVLLALSWVGPVVIGVDWLDGMFDVDAAGLIHAAGPVLGGHCTLLHGLDPQLRTVTVRNSWGPAWGRGGDAWLAFDDLARLLARGGEACVPSGRRRPPAV